MRQELSTWIALEKGLISFSLLESIIDFLNLSGTFWYNVNGLLAVFLLHFNLHLLHHLVQQPIVTFLLNQIAWVQSLRHQYRSVREFRQNLKYVNLFCLWLHHWRCCSHHWRRRCWMHDGNWKSWCWKTDWETWDSLWSCLLKVIWVVCRLDLVSHFFFVLLFYFTFLFPAFFSWWAWRLWWIIGAVRRAGITSLFISFLFIFFLPFSFSIPISILLLILLVFVLLLFSHQLKLDYYIQEVKIFLYFIKFSSLLNYIIWFD